MTTPARAANARVSAALRIVGDPDGSARRRSALAGASLGTGDARVTSLSMALRGASGAHAKAAKRAKRMEDEGAARQHQATRRALRAAHTRLVAGVQATRTRRAAGT